MGRIYDVFYFDKRGNMSRSFDSNVARTSPTCGGRYGYRQVVTKNHDGKVEWIAPDGTDLTESELPWNATA